jgi:hypothetical protein
MIHYDCWGTQWKLRSWKCEQVRLNGQYNVVDTNCHTFLGRFRQYIISTMLRSIGHNVQNT